MNGDKRVARRDLKTSHVASWFVYKGVCGPHKLFEIFVFSPLPTHCLTPYFRRMWPRRQANFREYLCTFKGAISVRTSQRTSFAILVM